MVDQLAMYATVESVCCVRGLASGATCTYAVRTRGSECVAVGGEARTRCAVWLFAVGSLRDFPESLAEGIYIPLCASGPQPRQFGGVCLTYEQRHHAFIHTLIVIHNVPDKRNEYSSPGGRRPQRAECSLHTRSLATANVRSCPTTVETCSVVSSSVIVSRDPHARVSLSFSSHRLAKQYVASFRWLLSFWPCWSSATRRVVVLANGATGWTWCVADEGSDWRCRGQRPKDGVGRWKQWFWQQWALDLAWVRWKQWRRCRSCRAEWGMVTPRSCVV